MREIVSLSGKRARLSCGHVGDYARLAQIGKFQYCPFCTRDGLAVFVGSAFKGRAGKPPAADGVRWPQLPERIASPRT